MASEQDLQTKIIHFLFAENIYAFKVVNATTAGHTDITACVNGVFVAIEVKAEHQNPTPLQEYTHKRILKSLGTVIVVHPSEFEAFKKLIYDLKKTVSVTVKKGKDTKCKSGLGKEENSLARK